MSKRPPFSSPNQAACATGRSDQIRKILEHCSSAKLLAERIDHPFLVYLLDMATEEARTALPHGSFGAAPTPARGPDQ